VSAVNRTNHPEAEEFMRASMTDSAHDIEHVYRVLNYACDIAKHENGVDTKLLTIACLLHDIGRSAQFADPNIDHALFGAEKAYAWLLENGYSEDFSAAVQHCIKSHRFRSSSPPNTLEAKILYDADKLEVCGAVGIARTLLYCAHVSVPLYSFGKNGEISDGSNDKEASFFQEYKFKLEKMYDKLYTTRGAELAAKRKSAAKLFYDSLLLETLECYGAI